MSGGSGMAAGFSHGRVRGDSRTPGSACPWSRGATHALARARPAVVTAAGRYRERSRPAVTVEARRALPHDATMTHRATPLCLAAALLVAIATLVQPGCARHGGDDSRLGPGGALAATSVSGARAPKPGVAQGPRPVATRIARLSGEDRLAAVCTVKRFCDLVGTRRTGQARELLGAPGLLRARGLRRASGIRFVAARAEAHPRAGTVTVAASVRVDAGSERPPRTGVDTLFFTLGRVGTTSGGWLITAVTTSP
jgi:hypothetical protein